MSQLGQRLVAIREHVAGTVAVSTQELRKKLGPQAWAVWGCLCMHRDRDGQTHISMGGLVRRTSLSEHAVERALKKLRAAGLLQNEHWQKKNTPTGPVKVRMRRVHGGLLLEGSRHLLEEALVPKATFLWCQAAKTRGGLRKGAGRKMKLPPEKSNCGDEPRALKTEKSNCGDEPRALISENNQTAGYVEIKPRGLYKSNKLESYVELFPSGKAGAPTSGAQPSTFFSSEMGAGFKSSETRPAGFGVSTPLPGVPPYPGISYLAPATTPRAPKLHPDGLTMDHLQATIAAYRGAVATRWPNVVPFVRLGHVPQKTKTGQALLSAIPVLVEKQYAPAEWALFMCDVWRDNAISDGPPPVTWVFSEKRVRENSGWFRAESGTYGGGHLVYGPKHTALLEKYDRMRRALLDATDVAQVVSRYFPGDTFERLVDEVKVEIAETQRAFKKRVEGGEFLWR